LEPWVWSHKSLPLLVHGSSRVELVPVQVHQDLGQVLNIRS
jgi:hypothetical protein